MSKEIEMLQRVPLFAEMPDTPVVYKGDPFGAMYLIVSGRVKVHQATAGGAEVILNVLGSGNFFGEMSLLDGLPRSADISTLENAELLLEGAALRDTIHAQPAVAWTLLRALTQRLRDQNERLEMLMTRDVADRVADCLLRLARTHGTPLPGSKTCVDVSLTQGDIAALVGATRERVSRALTAFRASGAILWDKDKSRWMIVSSAALTKRAQM